MRREEIALVVAFFGLGFYAAMLTVAVVLGNAGFDRAFPNPWRLLTVVPALMAWFVSMWAAARG